MNILKKTINIWLFYKILLNKIYNYINYYGIIYKIKYWKYLWSIRFIKTNQTLYKKLFDENIY